MKTQPNQPTNILKPICEPSEDESFDIKPMGPPTGQIDYLVPVYNEPTKNNPDEKTGKLKEVLENVLKDCQEKLDDVKYESRKYEYNHQKTTKTNIFKSKGKRSPKQKKTHRKKK